MTYICLCILDDLVLESVNADTIKELLQNSRATSRMASQSSMGSSGASGPFPVSRPGSQCHVPPPPRDFPESVNPMEGHLTHNFEYRKPFLPEIDPRGTMSTQKLCATTRLNNEEATYSRPSSSTSRGSAITVHNSFTGSAAGGGGACAMSGSFDYGSEEYESVTPTPHPPSESRKSSGGRNGRTTSPFTRSVTDKDCND